MSSLDSGVVVRVERVVDPKRACDVLVVGKEDLIDLEAEEYRDFPFQGTGAELEEEVRQVQELLMGCQPLAAPSSRRSKQRGSGGRRLPVLGHSGDRANEIDRENGRLVRRLQQVGNALPSGAMSGEEHDRHLKNAQASSMARRQKEEDHVMMENLGLYRKLQAVRPTSDVDRRKHADDFKASRRNLEKLRTRREDPRPAPPGAGQDKVWNDRWQCQENV